ncbi:MAG: PAS domain S-box protein [Natronomonas sp.]
MLEDREFFETLVEKGSDAIITIDETSTVLYANESVERIFGYDPETLIGEPLTTVMPERFQETHHDAVDRYLQTGDRQLDWNDVRIPGERADGTEVPLSVTFEEHTYDGNTVFSGIIRDISEQKRYQRTLETLQETARDLLKARDADEISEVVVTTVDEVLDFPMSILYLYDDTEDVLRPAAYTDTAERMMGEIPVFSGGDSLTWAAFEAGESRMYDDIRTEPGAHPGTDVQGLLIIPLGRQGALLVGNDKPIERDDVADLAHLLAANAEAALNRADRESELQRQNERLEKFASILSHDLRDPLNTAQAQIALARQSDPEAIDDHLEALSELHDRMSTLIDDVLTLTKEGTVANDPETIDFAEVVESAWSTARDDSATIEIDGDLGTIRADSPRLQRLLENLFGNAARHAGDDVTVRVGRLEGGGGFYVEDDGPGIPADKRQTVFEYGYTDDDDGTGLGLNIVETIARAHGWSTRATESPEGGARFEFRFVGVPA